MESSEPPVRLVTLKSNGYEVKTGNEVVLFRHEKTFYNKPGLFLRVRDRDSLDEVKSKVKTADQYMVNYVGIELRLDGFAVEAVTGDPDAFAKTVAAVREVSHKPLILISRNPEAAAAGLSDPGWRATAALRRGCDKLASDGSPGQAVWRGFRCCRDYAG